MNDAFRFCQADDSRPDSGSDPDSDPKTPSSRPDSATPEEGQLGTVTLDELFYLLTYGAIGTKPLTHANTSTTTTLPPQD